MPNRILKDSICTSPNIDQLSRDAEVFFYRLIVHCDDFGRMDARLPILRAKCYPLQIGTVLEDNIAAWLSELEAAHLVTVYTVEGQDYLQMRTWDKHQQIRAKRSKYPSLQDSDSNRNHLIADDGICPRNPIQSNPIVIQHDDDDERKQAIADLQVLGLFNRDMLTQFDDLWPELSGRRDWVGKAITVARDKNASSPAYALKVLANAVHLNQEPGYINGKGKPSSTAPKSAPVTHIINPITGQPEAVNQ